MTAMKSAVSRCAAQASMLPNSFRLMRIQKTPKPSRPTPKSQPRQKPARGEASTRLCWKTANAITATGYQEKGAKPNTMNEPLARASNIGTGREERKDIEDTARS